MAETMLTGFDLTSASDYQALERPLRDLLARHETANRVFGHLGHSALRQLTADEAPDAFRAIGSLVTNLDEEGAVVLHATGVDEMEDEMAQLTSISIGSIFGHPTKTDKRKAQIAWPVMFDPDTTVARTFSQTLGEAAFHTDTQYFEHPEKYFGLFCIHADVPGKGTNLLLDGVAALDRFRLEHDEAVAAELQRPYPFRVPSVFTEGGTDRDIEVTWAPIFEAVRGTVRYRKDTIERALTVAGVKISDGQAGALELFDSHVETMPAASYHLQPGDALLVNNHRMLHARTAFDDELRKLYRVRMSNDAAV